jgi:hypothetical protein
LTFHCHFQTNGNYGTFAGQGGLSQLWWGGSHGNGEGANTYDHVASNVSTIVIMSPLHIIPYGPISPPLGQVANLQSVILQAPT